MIFLFKHFLNNLGYIIVVAFLISRLPVFAQIIRKEKLSYLSIITLGVLFGGLGIIGTYVGVNVKGAIANTRNIGVMVGGILCGPYVGIIAGIIAGLHRLLIDIGGITSLPCAIATIIGGIISGFAYKKSTWKNKWLYGFIAGVIIENISALLILIFARPFHLAIDILKYIYLPMMFANGAGISIIILLTENIFDTEELIAAKQSKQALEIANRTLPHFRRVNKKSLNEACQIIKESIGAMAVSITDTTRILAHVGAGADHHTVGIDLVTEATKRAIRENKIEIVNTKSEIECKDKNCPLMSAVIVPLKEKDKVIGVLKIYYDKENSIGHRDIMLVKGLSQLISTQIELSKIEHMKNMANKSEIKALQAQINPHFLFNALNTIVSFTRINPDKARELIINLSTYLRYNIENENIFVDLNKELEQVKAYVQIEQARYKDKIEIIYDIKTIKEEVKIPSLTIQPLVENAIKHGILKKEGRGKIYIRVKERDDDKILIEIKDEGIGIDEEVIEKIYKGKNKAGSVGLSNVHNRLKLIYGQGLTIEKCEDGTRIWFYINRDAKEGTN
ncbi:sensor histidine kinase [Anaeromicrobium sediminis]|uniref:histidine kinase n=1 Tax=Anaeromicrobium sediminis TaxID=1478221 RepID=A0A267MKT9_9FIRM|nr:sensor histidine kinase [Anaeromicrobium sediminis]